ncbi:transposase [Saccharopolyspora sp. 5N102]|uniref:transposase n=1 Tax=Saccharopolyspora sp. 5N102 TaxID=3375155 RepID=UPI00378FE461
MVAASPLELQCRVPVRVHLVWCPEFRRSVIGGRMEQRFKEFICEVVAEKGVWPVESTSGQLFKRQLPAPPDRRVSRRPGAPVGRAGAVR